MRDTTEIQTQTATQSKKSHLAEKWLFLGTIFNANLVVIYFAMNHCTACMAGGR